MEAEKLLRALESLSTWTLPSASGSDAGSVANSVESGLSQSLSGHVPVKKPSFIKRRSASKVLGFGGGGVAESKARLVMEVAEALTSGTAPEKGKDFAGILAQAIEHLVHCCDDADASVRLAAEEALNIVLKEHILAQQVTILIELFKQVKKNDKPRCVKAAWSRLAFFANYAKPQRFRNRAFAVNMLPCIIQLARRDEDSVQEALTEGLPAVLKVLGLYLTEGEIKSLTRTFLPSLSAESGLRRRTAATNLVTVARYSKKPELAFLWLLRGLLGLARSSADNAPSAVYAGVLLTLKNILHFLSSGDGANLAPLDISILIQVLRLILDCCAQTDHNVQGFALDALHALLTYPSPAFHALLSTPGPTSLQISPSDSNASSDFSLDFGAEDTPDNAEELAEISVEALTSPAPVIGRPVDSVSEVSDAASIMSSVEDAFTSADDNDYVLDYESPMTEGPDFGEELEVDSEERSGEEGMEEMGDGEEAAEGVIGRLFGEEAALVYIARYLSIRFLVKLDGSFKSGVRVSVQNNALVCLSDIITKFPAVVSEPLLPHGENSPLISANLAYLSHTDPLLQAHAAILTAVCIAQNIPCSATALDLLPTVDTILRLVQSESASAGKLAVEALSICTLALLYTSLHAPIALSIVRRVLDILHQRHDLYWLLKVELLQFLRTVPLNWVVYTESMVGRESHRKLDVFEETVGVLMRCLHDSDTRVSRTAVDSLCWMPYSFAFPKLASPQTYRAIIRAYEEGGKGSWEGLWYAISTGLTFPYNVHDFARSSSSVEDAVSAVVGMVLDVLIAGPKKEDLHGPIAALTRLSMLYPPTVYASCWFGPVDENDLGAGKISSSATGILRRLLELAMHSGIASDLTVHADLLRLIGSYLAGLAFIVHGKAKSASAEESPWIFAADVLLRTVIENLLRHLARMLCLMKAVTEGQKLTDVFPSLKSSLLLPTPQALTATLRRRHGTDTLRKTDRKSRNLFDIKGKSGLGALVSADVYGGVLDAMKKAWQKQRTILSADIRTDKFRGIMASVLISLSQVLEVIPADLVAPHTEELIRYLRVTMGMEGAASIYCIEQLLRCLFACNLGQTDNHSLLKDARTHFTPVPAERNFLTAFVENSSKNPGFFPLLYALPLENGTVVVVQEEEWGQRWARSWEMRRLEDLEALFKSYSKEKRAAMSETIRQFEAVVIKALQLYTCTTDIATQSQVLDLLVVLLHLHVNYNVLDGEHIFLKYTLKQVELMEVNHINEEDAGRLLPYLFRFFIHLSHDKFIFQQRILTYGNVMQLGDSLMAGGKAVVGLLNLLFDDAVFRKWAHTVNAEERDAQLEVVLSMLLRCVPQPEAFGLLHKFVMYQLRNSSGIYETKTRDLVEAVFGRLSAADMNYSTLQDFFRTCAFLDVTRSQNLIESAAFERLFHSLVQFRPRSIGAAAFLAAIIDGFLSNGMVRPLLKLFANINQNHPLESPGDLSHETAGRQFVQTMADLLDSIGQQPSNPLTDYIQCSLLKSLTYFAEVVAQGALKSILREIDKDKDRFRPMPVACMVAWMRFRHASTGCDMEARFWNRTGKFPLEEHMADVMWNFVRSPVEGGQLPFSGADEAFRVLQDYLNDDLSVVEVELLHERFGNNSVAVLDELVKKVMGMDGFSVVPLFARPGGLTVQLGLVNMLSSHADSVPVLTGESKDSLTDSWTDEKYDPLKQVIFRLCGLYDDPLEDSISEVSDPSVWLTGFIRRVALHSRNDHADAIAAVMQGLDEETVLTIVTDQGFSPTILRSCFRGKLDTFEALDKDKLSVLFRAASDVLLEKIAGYVAEESSPDSVNAKSQREWLVLAGALVEYGSRVVQTGGSVPEEAMESVLQFGIYGLKVYTMPGCEYSRLMYRRSLQSVLVCLASLEWSSWIRRNPLSGDRVIQTVGVAVQKECAFLSGEMAEQADGLVVALVDWFEKCFPLNDQLLSDVIVGLARFPSYIELIRIPPSVHKAGWSASAADTGPIPAEFLQELGVLKEFVGRVGHFGWSSRRSFEEIWMALLSVLSSVPIDEESAADEAQRDGSPVSRIAAGRVALRCITALLLESVLASRPGNPISRHNEVVRHQSPRRRLDDYYIVISSRHCHIAAEYSWVQQFARCARRPVYFHLSHFDGLEESSCHWVMKGSPQAAAVDGADVSASSNNQIDLKSCLKFVMDLYSHWTSDEKLKRLSPYILDEVTKSTVLLSNIFHDEKNFRWMLSLVHQIQRVKNVEDSMLYGHLMDAVGKVASVLDDEKDAINVVRKSAESKASQSLVNRVCCSRMVLRLLHQQTPGDAQSHKLVQWLLNLSTTIFEVESRARISSGDVMDVLHSILIVEIDFFVAKPKDTINPYRDMLIQQLHNVPSLPFPSLKTLLLALARHLIDKRPDDGVFREQLIKVALESIFLPPPRSLALFGFLLCCLEDGKNASRRGGSLSFSPDDAMADIHNDPLLIMTMEKLALIQQRVGRCYAAEHGMLGALFTSLLTNKMPLHEAINRVMAEFQSAPLPLLPFTAQLMSTVAERVKKEGLLSVMEEWIALSLANFAHRQPPGVGAWSLACLFVSASSSGLVALSPYLRARGPQMDRCLREIFLHAGRSFAAQMRVEPVHQLFMAAVQTAAANQSDDLMASLQRVLSGSRRDVA